MCCVRACFIIRTRNLTGPGRVSYVCGGAVGGGVGWGWGGAAPPQAGGDGDGDDAENNCSQPPGPSPSRPRIKYPVEGNPSLRPRARPQPIEVRGGVGGLRGVEWEDQKSAKEARAETRIY